MLKDCVLSVPIPQALSFWKQESETAVESWLAMTYIPGHALGDPEKKMILYGQKGSY